ncbi:sodium-dependent transporter [Clostridium sp. BJN0001]|uniref:sodium-dependent transporter n=1 Tax=Clostridium sp. BJN0001 TaxID=2930219 RepID=UPI001FD366F4|nr:sodium-dependent transporter [Clostridium sp. BJN0001]
MENKREEWNNKLGFILAAVGSAVGLGNIWRYPYLVYANGGGAFLIPYFVAIITAAIPLLILEYGMGHKYKGSTPLAIARANKKWEWMGWWPTVSAFIILVYYSMILSWAIKYFLLSFTKGWGENPNDYFYNDFLHLSSSPFEVTTIIWPIFICILLLWAINFFICYRGIKKGIEKINKLLLPMLIIIMIIIVIRGVTLDGASAGLNKLFTPDFDKMRDPSVWVAAYGQVFFSLSIGMGIMMTYSSYLPKKSDINNSAFMTSFANCGFEFLCAIGVFSILGFMATSEGVPVDEVVSSGIGLAFIVFPKVFSIMGTWGNILGTLFFACLIFAGTTSTVSLVEAVSSPIIDKSGWSRKKVVSLICGTGSILSIAFATNAGLYFLDIIDNFINNYGIITIGFLEAVFVGWILKPDTIRNHTNSVSYFKIGKWWNLTIKYITPFILGFMLISSIIKEINSTYGGYSFAATFIYGWGVVGAAIIIAIIITRLPWKNKNLNEFVDEEE